jgi:hypothetical protein
VDLSPTHGHATGFVSSQDPLAAARSLGSDNEMTVADCWFAALDQRRFAAGERRWTTRVMGVHLDGLHTWIQLEFAEHPTSSLILHLTPWAGLHDAVNMIRAEIMRGDSEPL